MKARKSFILHFDSLGMLDELTDEQAGKLFKAIKANRIGEEIEVDLITKIALSSFKAQFARDDDKYKNVANRNGINGSKGGRPKKTAEPKKPSGLIGNPNEPRKADSVSVSDSDSDSDSEVQEIGSVSAKPKPRTKFKQPESNDVFDYLLTRGIDQATAAIESEKFADYYQSNGWKVGKNSMKCWKSAARNWTKNINRVVANNGTQNGNQPRKSSMLDRVKQQAADRLRSQETSAPANREFSVDAMAEIVSDVRLQVYEPVRGDTRRDVDNVLNGDYWPTNG